MKKIAGLILFILCGCAPHFTVPSPKALLNPPPPLQEDWGTELLTPEFSHEGLRSGGMALLAILSQGAPEGLRQNAAFEIFQGLRASFPEVRIVPRSDAIEKITVADQVHEFDAFIHQYQERRSMNLNQLKKWGELQGVRYLFIGKVESIDKHTEAPIVQKAERGIAGQILVFSSGPIQIPGEVRKQISLRGEIWDSQCGKAVWMGRSEAEVIESVETERVRVEDIFISVGRNLSVALAKALKEKGPSKRADC
jgi:hypothetical protein